MVRAGSMSHLPGGSNVLYIDGHVAFQMYKPTSPCYDADVAILLERESFPISAAVPPFVEVARHLGL